MKLYKIRNTKNGMTFEKRGDALGDLQPEWGKPSRWVHQDELEKEGIRPILNDKGEIIHAEGAVDVRPSGRLGEENKSEYLIPDEFEIVEEDITAKVAKAGLELKATKAQAIGAAIIGKVWAVNEGKKISDEQFQAIMGNEQLKTIERLLWNGSLKTARRMINQLDNSFFTKDEIKEILDILDNAIG